ncbi:MAG: signal peptidase I [Sedimentisphaerales bacterium]|nr:signal peptidase I [Sedimentisphaerales bacterium]
MTEETVNIKHRRLPWLAVVLSWIMAGLGHIYCGRFVKGLIFTFLVCIFIPIFFGALSVGPSSVRVMVIILSLLISLVVWLAAIIDSWHTAKHTSASYTLKDYNRWYVYVLLVLMGTGGSTQIAFNIRATLLEAFRAPTASLYPTIVPNDRILANKLAYKNKDPKRGDLIVFLNPKDRRQNYIKRVIATAGDTFEIKDGQLFVNDEQLQRQKLSQTALENIRIEVNGEPLEGEVFEESNGNSQYQIFLAGPPHNQSSTDFAKITIPEHHCFVLGDNRNLSFDSRQFGPIPLATVIGRADYLYWPVQDWSRFGRIKY